MNRMLLISATAIGVAFCAPTFAQGMSPDQYLMQARSAVEDHQATTAITDISSAENVLVQDRAAYEGRSTRDLPGEPAVIRQIGRAREAVQEAHWQQAEMYLDAAMSHPSAAVPGYGSSS